VDDRRSIIIIDDEFDSYTSLSPLLLDRGFVITEAGTAHEALKRLIDNHYDLAFLDLELPDRNGLNLLPDIRLLDPEMPIMIVATKASLDEAVEALHKGAREYLLKPIDPKAIISLIEEMLGTQHQKM
jgi:two-component system, response regulator FlrC